MSFVDSPAQQLNQDASNRALRTFVQGLLIDVAVGVAALIVAGGLDAVGDWTALIAFLVSVAKTIVISAAAYVMRRFMDPSKFPTPLPPNPQPAPSTTNPAP